MDFLLTLLPIAPIVLLLIYIAAGGKDYKFKITLPQGSDFRSRLIRILVVVSGVFAIVASILLRAYSSGNGFSLRYLIEAILVTLLLAIIIVWRRVNID